MTKVLWHVTMSLDGFIAAPGGGMDWVFRHAGPNETINEFLPTIGAVLAGRRSYDVTRAANHKPYGGAFDGPLFVLTHRARSSSDATFLSGDLREAVRIAREAANGRNVVVFGADIARQCLAAGLIDEIFVHQAPILLGDGTRLFGGPGAASIDLETIDVSRAGQIVNQRFRVISRSPPP